MSPMSAPVSIACPLELKRTASQDGPPAGQTPHRRLPCGCTDFQRPARAAARSVREGKGGGSGGLGYRLSHPKEWRGGP
uniref:Uncharacterized protein n=1 Tax=Arundo donax TaxID=35708 RepID=A0A0A8ZVC8_ARUDO